MNFFKLIRNYPPHFIPLFIFVGLLLVSLIVRTMMSGRIRKWVKPNQIAYAEIFHNALRIPSFSLCWILAIYGALQFANFPAPVLFYFNKAFGIIFILSIAFIFSRLIRNLLTFLSQESEALIPVLRKFFNILEVFIFLAGLLIIAGYLDVPVFPFLLLLSLLAIILIIVFQDTFKNLVALINLQCAKTINPGDFIQLSEDIKGFIIKMDWQNTQLQDLANNIILIPNHKLIGNIITNYSLKDKRVAVIIRISTNYNASPDYVERILLETAIASLKHIPGLATDPQPTVRFDPGFGESSLDFSLLVYVNEFTDKFFVRHELRKRIFQVFREKGIKLPHPVRTIYVAQNQ